MNTLDRLTTALADRYRVDRELGAGGMATVYLAHDLRHERDVAIKVLHPDLGAALGADRFLAEIKTTAKLQHPHILPLLDSGAADGLLYYVMPLVTGESLRARLTRETQLPIDEAVRIAGDVAEALGAAHAMGVVHRDVKPENILLQAGRALVADFGIALAVQHAGAQRLTQTGLSLGTPQYMAPEQAMGERVIDARADLYALGAVTYEMLTGDPPFAGASVQAIVAKVMTERPVAPRTVRDTVPLAVERAVLKALSKLPADRFGTAAAFVDALRERGSQRGEGEPTVSRGIRSWIWPAVAALMTVVAVVSFATSPVGPSRLDDSTAPQVHQYDLALPDSFQLYIGAGPKFALSPDGRRTVFVATRGGRTSLLLREQGDAVARPIEGTEGLVAGDYGYSPSFSPDGEWIVIAEGKAIVRIAVKDGRREVVSDSAYFATFVGADSLLCSNGFHTWLVTPRAGPPRHLASVDSSLHQKFLMWPAPVLGKRRALIIIDYSPGIRELDSLRLGVLDLETGKLIDTGLPATNVRGGYDDWVLVGQPGGRVAAMRFDAVAAKAARAPQVVIDGVWQGAGGATAFDVSKNGDFVYLPAGQGGANRSRLFIVDATGRRIERPIQSGDVRFVRASPDGRRLLLATGASTNGVGAGRVLDLSTGLEETSLKEGESGSAVWTADSRGLLFGHSEFSGGQRRAFRLQLRRIDGRAPDSSIAIDPAVSGVMEVSWPARRMAIMSNSGIIRIAPLDSLERATQARTAGASPRHPAISPDGKWLAYSALDGVVRQTYVQALDGDHERLRLSVVDGSEPRWSADGKSVYFRSSTNVMRARVDLAQRAVTRLDTLFADQFPRIAVPMVTWDLLGADQFVFISAPLTSQQVHVLTDWRPLLTSSLR